LIASSLYDFSNHDSSEKEAELEILSRLFFRRLIAHLKCKFYLHANTLNY